MTAVTLENEIEQQHQQVRVLVEQKHPKHRVTRIVQHATTTYGAIRQPPSTQPPQMALERVTAEFTVEASPIDWGEWAISCYIHLLADGRLDIMSTEYTAGGIRTITDS